MLFMLYGLAGDIRFREGLFGYHQFGKCHPEYVAEFELLFRQPELMSVFAFNIMD
jgi:hypothetical protein